MALTTVSSDRLSTNVKNTNFTAAEKQDLTDDILPLAGQLGNRNLIINGAMQVAQRGTSQASITTSGFYTVDRFATSISGLGTWTQSQDTTVPTAKGFTKSLKMDVTTADSSPAAGDFCVIQYKIEAQDLQLLKYGTSSAETITLKFHVRSPKTGTHIVHIYQNDGTRHISKAYTISSADTYQEVTINIEGDTGGTINNDNGIGLQVEFFLGAGTNFTSGTLATSWAGYTQANSAVGQVNCADNTANNFFITGVQLEVGTVATDFEHRSFGQELALCQRYFNRYNSETVNGHFFLAAGYNSSNAGARGSFPFTVPMRAIPSFALSNLSHFQELGSGKAMSSITLADSGTGTNLTGLTVTFSSNTTAGFAHVIRAGSTSAYFEFSAEL